MSEERVVITISHQLGSGGSYLGKQLSERLAIPFVDRDILKRVAEQIHVSEAELVGREERLSSFWQSFSRMALFTDPIAGFTLNSYVPADRDLFELESDYIARIAERTSAIILGRCGRTILRDHPHRLSILVHAALPVRIKRIR